MNKLLISIPIFFSHLFINSLPDFGLTAVGFGAIVSLLKWQRRRRNRAAADREEPIRWKGFTTRGGRTTPEPPGTTGPGLSRYRKAQAASDHVSPVRGARLPSDLGWRPGPAAPPLAPAPVCPRRSRRPKRFLQAGWNRGAYLYVYASPLTNSGVRRFVLPRQKAPLSKGGGPRSGGGIPPQDPQT